MRTALYVAALLALAAVAVLAGHVGYTRQAQAYALQCARASDGADASIAECFTRYGLAVPEDL